MVTASFVLSAAYVANQLSRKHWTIPSHFSAAAAAAAG
jgi:hypothetical protein